MINDLIIFFSVQEFELEGKNAIESPGSPTQFDIPPEDYDLGKLDFRVLVTLIL